jgi:hypothetical protein
MDSWIECAWFQCRKRFEPGRAQNQFHRAGNKAHKGARYCCRSCQQKAYRLRRATVTQAPECSITHATVTRTLQQTENIDEIRTKNAHARSFKVIAGPVENYSVRSLAAAAIPLDPVTAESQRRANDPETIRRETAWGRKSVTPEELGGVCSNWKPCLPHDHTTLPGLPIPDFLMRTA